MTLTIKDNGIVENVVEKENRYIKMVLIMMVIGFTIKLKEMGDLFMQMAMFMKENGGMVMLKEMECLHVKMDQNI